MDSKLPSFRIDPPEELVFRGPFDQPVTQRLKIENTGSDGAIGFKVKTTTPKKFSVKPNFGSIDARGAVDINISIQPFTYDPNDKARHKFMVQIVALPSGQDSAGVEALIKDLEKNNPGRLRESKLRVSIIPGGESDHMLNGTDARIFPSEDLKKLESDISQLRLENSQLKEENAIQRKQIGDLEKQQPGTSPGQPSIRSTRSTAGAMASDPNQASGGFSLYRLIFILIILLLGMALGVYISSNPLPRL
jgi:hypothetical protein